MKKSLPYLGIASCSLLLLASGCMDDKYDLSDIDTTTRINVNDLVVPVNLKAITLDEVLDLDDSEIVKEVTLSDGSRLYAIWEDGTIDSDDITIDPIKVTPHIDGDSQVPVEKVEDVGGTGVTVRYGMEEMSTDFSFNALNVDKSVKSISELKTAQIVNLEVKLVVPSTISVSKIDLENIEINFPKNLYLNGAVANASVGTYNANTGIVTIPSYSVSGSNSVVISLSTNDIRPSSPLKPDASQNLTYSENMGTSKTGHITVTTTVGTLPANFDLSAEYDITSEFYIKNFSGEIDYQVDINDLEAINLDDLPDFLDNKTNNVILNNPQVYLGVDNGAFKYGGKGSADLKLISHFESKTAQAQSEQFLIDGAAHPGTKYYNLMLSPVAVAPLVTKADEEPQANYTGAHAFKFPNLNNILTTGSANPEGLPEKIDITINSPSLKGQVKDFPVEYPGGNPKDYTLPGLNGEYLFYAPLAFDQSTNIVYNKIENDWDSDDLKDLKVRKLRLEATAKSLLPVEVALAVYPLNKEGERLGRSDEFILPAFAEEKVVLNIEQKSEDEPITGIDGIDYRAIIRQTATGAGTAISPDQSLELTDIRITVSGYYEKEF